LGVYFRHLSVIREAFLKVKTHLLGKKTIVVRGKAYEVDRFLFWKYWIWDSLAYAGQRVWEFLKLFADFLETLGDVLLWMISGRWLK
jgi:hypothetical protein